MDINFKNISYLSHGNTLQQQAFKVLSEHNVLEKLKDYNPILVGTIPINIAIETSDLDIICCWHDKEMYRSFLNDTFHKEKGFNCFDVHINGVEAVVANFKLDDFEVELFGQSIPSVLQNGYRHMLIEHEILNVKGEAFRKQIIRLKKEGIKTEPAFAKLLGIEGDPYIELLKWTP